MADFLSITFTDEDGASATRTAGPDLSTFTNPQGTLWGDRARLMLNTLYEERHGEVSPNLGASVQSLADRFYQFLRSEEKRIRTEAAVAAAEATEDEQFPDE